MLAAALGALLPGAASAGEPADVVASSSARWFAAGRGRMRALPRVTIQGDGEPIAVDVPAGTTLFEAGARLSAGIDTACVGKGTCGLCRVKVVGGAEHLSPYGDEERKHLGNVYHLTRVRLACRSRLTGGDVAIQIVRRKK